MGDVGILEATQHVDNGVRRADIAQKLVAQTFALRGTLHQTGNIDNLDRRGDDPLRVVDLGQTDQTLIGYGDHADVGFDRAEREVGCLRLCVRQTVEKGRFTHVRETHNAAL